VARVPTLRSTILLQPANAVTVALQQAVYGRAAAVHWQAGASYIVTRAVPWAARATHAGRDDIIAL
jgi:hypothetical protein